MNVYYVSAGLMEVVIEYIEWDARCEIEHLCGIVTAKTRGKAKALFAEDNNIEFTDIKTTILLDKDTTFGSGVNVTGTDHYWDSDKIINKPEKGQE